MVRRQPFRAESRSRLAWFGLFLLVGSFAWLVILPKKFSHSLTNPETTTAENFNLIIIDPGHGGQDSGTIRAGVLEKDLSLDVAQRLARLFVAQGLATFLTRSDDHYVSLAGRTELANKQRDAIFVSIHFDEAARASATGIETYYAAHQISAGPPVATWLPFLQRTSMQEENTNSQNLASFVQRALVAHTKAFDRGTRAEQFFVIANVIHPAILVEGGFLTNKDDIGKLASEIYREDLAAAICEGILRYRELMQQKAINASDPRT